MSEHVGRIVMQEAHLMRYGRERGKVAVEWSPRISHPEIARPARLELIVVGRRGGAKWLIEESSSVI
jgi:hypothetical protein